MIGNVSQKILFLLALKQGPADGWILVALLHLTLGPQVFFHLPLANNLNLGAYAREISQFCI